MDKINKVQELQFELIKIATFNEFDGHKVVEDLKRNKHLWDGVIMDRFDPIKLGDINLIKLRDIKYNCWNVDTLYILTDNERVNELESLVGEWNADSIDVISGMQAQDLMGYYDKEDKDTVILKVWWD